MLEVHDLTVRFGGVTALDGPSVLRGAPGDGCALIGPNGAGKTTLFNVVSRLYKRAGHRHASTGSTCWPATPRHRRLGIARTFQNVALFPALTVLENVMIGAHRRGHVGFGRAMRRSASPRRSGRRAPRPRELLDRLGLGDLADRPAAGLPFGTLKRIEFARALASRPRLLMLDEPANGLTHGEVDELGTRIRDIRDEFDLTMLLVEHHMAMVMAISDHIVVLDFGRKIAEGPPAEVRNDPRSSRPTSGTG